MRCDNCLKKEEIVFTTKDFLQALKKAKKGSTILFNECERK